MTVPVLPRGSQARSSRQVASEEARSTPGETAPATSAEPGLTGALGLEAAFVAAGDAGLPVRFGLLGQFRPHPILGLGLRIDTNFSDEIITALRAEGRVSVIPELQLYAAVEGGLRVLMGQAHSFPEMEEPVPVTGVLGVLGGEVGVRIPVDDVSIDLWGRLLYSPQGSVSYPGMDVEGAHTPAQGGQLDGLQFSVGVRLNLEFPTGQRPSQEAEEETAETEAEASAPLHETRSALRSFHTSLSSVIQRAEEMEEAATPEPTQHEGPTRSEILSQIQGDLQSLDESAEALDQEISGSLSEYNDWIEGNERLSQLQLRMDRIYFDQLSGEPPQVDLDTINRFTRDFNRMIQSDTALRYHLRQRGSGYGNAEYIDSQLRAFMGKLSAVQIQAYRDTSLGIAPADLDAPIAAVVEIRRHIRELGEEEAVDFRPSTERMASWRSTLETMAARIEQLNGDVPEELKQELRERHSQLTRSFEEAVANVEREASHISLYREEIRPHVVAFFGARDHSGEGTARQRRERSGEALGHIQALARALGGTTPSFRRRYLRTIQNISEYLNRFVRSELPGQDANWHRAGESALEILRTLNPEYQAPTLARVRRARVTRRRDSGTTRTPVRRGGGRGESASSTSSAPTPPPPPPPVGGGE